MDDKDELVKKLNDINEKRSSGLGDTIHKVAKVLGADKLAKKYEKYTGRDCGCEERREALNELVSYYNENKDE